MGRHIHVPAPTPTTFVLAGAKPEADIDVRKSTVQHMDVLDDHSAGCAGRS